MSEQQANPGIGVIIVTYKAAGFIGDCLESLLASGYPGLKIAVIDNASPDTTVEALRAWAGASAPELRADWPFGTGHRAARPVGMAEYGPEGPPPGSLGVVTLIKNDANLGYAGGVNRGLRAFLADPEIDLFWVLNPDTVVEPQTPGALARQAMAADRPGLIGGRVVFFADPGRIQIDGGRLHPLTASVTSVHFGQPAASTPAPDPATIAFISGASVMASRAFVQRAGLMDERYFLYFEEIDWQLRRGDLPLAIAPDAIVRHHAGITIGSGGMARPSALSVWFTYRNFMRFAARWFPWRLPFAYAFSWLRMARNLDGSWGQAMAFLTGIHGSAPPRSVRAALPASDWPRILGKPKDPA